MPDFAFFWSLRRRPESSISSGFWTPVFAGVTDSLVAQRITRIEPKAWSECAFCRVKLQEEDAGFGTGQSSNILNFKYIFRK
jgi:hypothetical protein